MNFKTLFSRLGYPRHTEKVYQTLLDNKDALSVTTLAKKTKVSRMAIYRILTTLLKDELVQKISLGKRTAYVVGNPRKLSALAAAYTKETASLIEQKAGQREKDVPHTTHFLHGAAGIRAAFDDVIARSKHGDTFFRYTSEKDLHKVNQYLAKDYRIRRDKKKLERLVISNTVSGKQKRPRLERFIKYIPPETDQFEQNIIQLVYGDRLSIMDLTAEEVMIIENKQLAEFQKVIFRLLYKKL